MRIMLHDAQPVNRCNLEGSLMMKRSKPSHPLVANQPYDGFWFQPVSHTERSQQKVQREELPARFQEHHLTMRSKQRGLI